MDVIKGTCGKVDRFVDPAPPFVKHSKKLEQKK